MNAEALILRYHAFNGKPLKTSVLKNYLLEVQEYLTSIGQGPYVPTLNEIRSRVTKAINKLNAKRIEEIENAQIEPIVIKEKAAPKPKTVSQSDIRKIVKEEIGGQLDGIRETPVQLKKIAHELKKFKEHKLKTSHGTVVTEKAQAEAIALREAGVPKKKNGHKKSKKKSSVLKGIGENKSQRKGIVQDAPLPKVKTPIAPPTAEPLPSKVVSAEDLAGIAFKTFMLDEPYKTDFHKINSDSQIMIWGAPGSGKTVYILKFAQYLAEKLGLKVLFVANEEFKRSTFAEKIKKFNIGHANLKFTKDLDEDLIDQYDVIIPDSINSLGITLDEYHRLVQDHPGRIFIIVVQSTKDGDFRGGKDWEHEVDIAGEIVDRRLNLRKNRLDEDNATKADARNKQEAIDAEKRKLEIKQAVKESIKPQPSAPQPIAA